jgi:hypothetical protein
MMMDDVTKIFVVDLRQSLKYLCGTVYLSACPPRTGTFLTDENLPTTKTTSIYRHLVVAVAANDASENEMLWCKK